MSKPWEDRWLRYDLALKAALIPGKLRAPHRVWVEGFCKGIRPRKWWAAELGDVEEFLRDLNRKGRPEWQQAQASRALRIFFQEVEPAPWAVAWPEAEQPGSRRGPMAPDLSVLPSYFNPLLERMEKALGSQALRTRQTYLSWVRRFLAFRKVDGEIVSSHAGEFLSYLADERKVSDGTRAQAWNALRVFFSAVLLKDLGLPRVGAGRRARQPAILDGEEFERVLLALPEGANRTLARLLFATGMTLADAVRLRVRDLDFQGRRIRLGAGPAARSLPLPEALVEVLWVQLDGVQKVWEAERNGRADPEEGAMWRDCWVFPSDRLKMVDGQLRRNPIHPQSFQQLLARAVRRAGLGKTVTPQTLRHSFAVRSLREGMEPRMLQKLLGHADVGSTMGYVGMAKTAPVAVVS